MKQEDNNDGRTVVNHIYGFQFNGCNITNPTFQTLVQGGASDGMIAVPEPSGAASDRERASVAEPVAASESVSEPVPALPEALLTDEACRLRERLSKAGILDERWQPVGLSNAEKGVLASLLADRLGIGNLWQTFGSLWGMKPETLRTAYNRGMEQKRTGKFLERAKREMRG